ncbi:putative LPS assembly protein LptD, partial [candidate division KSB1 bacterium]
DIHRYDRFSTSIFGGTPSGKSQTMSLSLKNLYQIKTSNGEKESKYDLINLNFSTNYNFSAENFKLGNLRTSFRTLSFFDIDINAIHSFYPYDVEQKRVVDRIIKGFPRLVNFQAVTSFRLSGSKETSAVPTEFAPDEEFEDTTKEDKQDRFFENRGSPSMVIPWNFSMGLRYSINKYNPILPSERFSLTPRLEFNLTKHWKVDYRAELDLISKKIINNDFTFYRDLHCWEFRFDWTPIGYLKGFFVIIRIKSPNLRDLKVEKKDYGGSQFGRGYY